MSKDLHQIDDIFKNGLEGKEDHPSPEVWENIEKELDQKKSKRPFLFFPDSRKIAAILLISLGSAALFAGGYFLRGFQMNKDKEPRNNPVIEKTIPGPGDPRDATNSARSSGTTEQHKVNEVHDADPRVQIKMPAELEKTISSASAGLPSREASAKTNSKAAETVLPKTSESDKLSKGSGSDVASESKAVKRSPSTSHATPPLASAQNLAPSAKTSNARNSAINAPPSTSGRVNETELVEHISHDAAVSKNDRSTNASASARPSDIAVSAPPSNASLSAPPSDIAVSTPSSDFAASSPLSEVVHPMAMPPVRSNRSVAAEKHLRTSSPAFSNNEPASAAAIPVLNKKQGSVNLPRFSLTPVIALQFGSNRIKENTAYANSGKVKDEITRTESQPASIAGGIIADLKISRNMTLQSGLVYTSRTIQIDPKNIIAERNPDGKVRYRFDCSAGTYFIKKAQGYTRPGDTAMTKFSTNDLNYLNIPLGLTYHFGGSSWHIFVMAGTGLNVLTRQYLETGLKYGYYEEDDTKVTNLKNSYFNGNIGAGIIWSPFKKISFNFSPQYQFALSPMNTNMPVKAYPRIFNIQTGMQIRL